MNRRILSLGLAAALMIGIGIAVLAGHGSGSPSTSASGSASAQGSSSLTTVRGVIGSEKAPFFADPSVVAALARHGYRVVVDTAGSREMATSTDLTKYDFAFPAGAPQGQAIKAKMKAKAAYVPFFTPMAIATFAPIVTILTAATMVTTAADGHAVLNVAKYLDAVAHRKRWSDIDTTGVYNPTKAVLISSTDVRTSNSAAMYLSIASYVANQGAIVDAAGTADQLIPQLAPLFLEQGFLASSSEEPFTDYLTIGIGKDPMVMVYEAQFRGAQIAKNPDLTDKTVLLYPSPTVYAKHTIVPFDGNGDAVAQLLLTDPDLQHLAVRFGFRTADAAYMQTFAQQQALPQLPALVDVVEPPDFTILERMINAISAKYTGVPSP
ncbi:MAG TPA: hypothetical protein VFO60_04825 [Candidatus Dormibacteraeota bacterium]|nr:hypothetical protein [Candidatus Dormibacteraeota bacterium]